MKHVLFGAAASALLAFALPAMADQDPSNSKPISNARVTWYHNGTRCLEFTTDKTKGIVFAVDSQPTPIIGGGVTAGGRGTQAKDVIAHAIARLPFYSFDYIPTAPLLDCENGPGNPAYDFESYFP